MRFAALLLVLAGLLAAAQAADPAPATPTLGQPFTLGVGQAATLAGTDLTVTFKLVDSDSRCPEGARCAWAGEAIVTLLLAQPNQPEVKLKLRVSDQAGSVHGAFHLQATGLTPYPKMDTRLVAGEYAVTLVITQPKP